MPRKRRRALVQLPKHVHRVTSRGKEYFYYQEGRGTASQGERVPLPKDPQQPDFWQAVRQAQGLAGEVRTDTIAAAFDAYLTHARFTKLGVGTQSIYKRELGYARKLWGALPAKSLKPKHIQAIMDDLIETPGKANNFLGTMRAFSKWAYANEWLSGSITEGIEAAAKDGGHKPWSPEQIRCAHDNLTGMVKRGVMLMLYTGQRGSDVVRLGPTFVDEGGFALGQTKTGVHVWCPIVDELAAEMKVWTDIELGPYLRQDDGRPYTRKRLSIHFREATEAIPLLKDTTLHGLRATAVVRLRREGLSAPQIQDIVGMSLGMIARYSRFADQKISGKAALLHLRTNADRATVKRD